MATQPPPNLPILYKNLQPLSSSLHKDFRTRGAERGPDFARAHAIPLTIDEFVAAQRFFPIVFSVGENPVPLGLMGLNEGVNVFVDEDGKLLGPMYVPAYVRRYPWMLAKLNSEAEELSLCFDPSSELVGDFAEGQPLFEGDKPSETLNQILKFCEEFEMAAQRTNAFMNELKELDLLIDGEVSIQPAGSDKPFIYRGFKMVAEEKLRDLPSETLHRIHQNGILPLLTAHLFSLALIRDVFGKQMASGKMPQPVAEPAPANA